MVGDMWEEMSRQRVRLPNKSKALDVEVRFEPLSIVLDPNLGSQDSESLDYLMELMRWKEFVRFYFTQEFSALPQGHFSVRPYDTPTPFASHEVKVVNGEIVTTRYIGRVDDTFRRVSLWEAHQKIVATTSRETLIAYLATNALGFHLFVTDSDFLLAHKGIGETFSVTPRDALAFAGLIMRMKGETVLGTSDRSTHVADNAWSYFIESRYLFQPVARYAMGDATQSRYSSLLGGAVQRCQQLLRIRDELVIYQMCPPGSYLTDPVFSFETFWLYTSGVFDCISAALNAAFEMGFTQPRAKFQRDEFRRALLEKVESVSIFAETSGTFDLIDLVSKLRNTIHEEPSSMSSTYGRDDEYFVRVASDVSETIRGYAEKFKLLTAIGVEDSDGCLHLKPTAFIECVLPLLIEHANGLVKAASWPRSASPPPVFSTSPDHMNYTGSAKRNHLLFGLINESGVTLATD